MNKMIWIAGAPAAGAALTGGCGGPKAAEAGKAEPQKHENAKAPAAKTAAAVPAVDPAQLAIENEAAAAKFLATNAKKKGVKTTASGLEYKILSEGPKDSMAPTQNDIVDVAYVATRIDGTEFDSSEKRGANARFTLGSSFPGWVEGLQLMKVGDKFRLFIPPDLAFGERGTPGGPIGPNEALVFDVELVKVTNANTNLAESQAFLAENAKKPGIKTTKTGLQYEVLTEGPADGASPTDADKVRVNYEGRLLDGTVFDSSYARGEPIEFPLAGVIAGWTEGLQLMSEGEKYRFYIPSDLAYGQNGTPGGPIGPNQALIFDVELLKVIK